MAPKPIVPMENGVDPREVEALIYMSVGVAIAFLLTASMMFAVCQCIAKYVQYSAKGRILDCVTDTAS